MFKIQQQAAVVSTPHNTDSLVNIIEKSKNHLFSQHLTQFAVVTVLQQFLFTNFALEIDRASLQIILTTAQAQHQIAGSHLDFDEWRQAPDALEYLCAFVTDLSISMTQRLIKDDVTSKMREVLVEKMRQNLALRFLASSFVEGRLLPQFVEAVHPARLLQATGHWQE